MQRKNIKRQNITQLLLMLVIIVLVTYISGFWFLRLDLTSEKRYTLSKFTRNLLSNINDKVYIKIYLDGDDMPVGFKRLRKATEELLDEFNVYARNKIEFEFINPSENADEKLRNGLYTELHQKGIMPIDLKVRDKKGKTSQNVLFPGAIVTYKGYELTVNFLKNNQINSAENNLHNSIQSLEYEFVNAINKLSIDKVRKIAFIEGHGELHELETLDITKTLSEYYLVQRGRIGGKQNVLDSFAAIIIAKPQRDFDEADKLVIDQYFMNGGKILWLIDGAEVNMDSLALTRSTIAMGKTYNLEDQLFKYGARINSNLVLDMQCSGIVLKTENQEGQETNKRFPCIFFPLIVTQNNHSITKYLDFLKTEFVSSMDTVGDNPDIKKTVLLRTSKYCKVEAIPMRIDIEDIVKLPDEKQFVNSPQAVSVLYEGKFESVFKNRPLHKISPYFDSKKFKSESKQTKMIVVADGDIIRNDVSEKGRVLPLGLESKYEELIYAGNKEFILNAVNYLCDDDGLMGLRLRELKLRLLDKSKIENDREMWQIINTLIPALLIVAIGILLNYRRKKIYGTKIES